MNHIDLNSLDWKCGLATETPDMKASVPGCIHSDLLNNGKIPDPFWGTNELDLQWIGQRDWQYEAAFDLGAQALEQEHIELVAEGLDTLASVFINGKCIARTDNMFIGYRWPVKHLLRAKGNTIRIVFADAEKYIAKTYTDHHPREWNDPVGRCTVIRKEQCQFGWDWGPRFVTAGIWKPIRIEAWSGNRIEHLRIVQEHAAARGKTAGSVRVRVGTELALPERPALLRATLSFGGEIVADAQLPVGGRGKGAVSAKKRAASAGSVVAKSAGRVAVKATKATAGAKTPKALVASEKSANPLRGLPEFVLEVKNPQLWWPAGQGAQPLYNLHVELVDAQTGEVLDTAVRRIGLRTITLNRSKDKWGEAFEFVVNGRAIFAKGANWIPAHSFVGPLRRKDYERDITAAVEANMNMLRVWGGGIYETDDFYDLCEELGLLVWQDFGFACTLTPDEDSFRDNARAEARYQIRRLHYRTSLALWCGNNELPQINKPELRVPAERAAYEKLFHQLLPEELAANDGITCYWPSSEWRGHFDSTHEDGEKSGDTHFWDVWHARHPVKDYEKWHFRFCSEFGMQSYSSLATQNTFCLPDEANIFGPVMENHQKNRAGNQIILDYISRRYRFPKDQASLIYLSQINQAYCMSVGIEHFRRISPRCMGALYWQLNDCWPVASWSSIEFTGAWRALHYNARRFFAPALVSAHVPEDEGVIIGNYRKPGSGRVDLYTVYDAPEPTRAVLRWELRDLHSAAILSSGEKKVQLKYGQSVRQKSLNLSKQLKTHGADNAYLRIALEAQGESATAHDATRVLSEETVFFTAPRFLNLPRAKTRISAKAVEPGVFEVSFTSDAFQHRFAFEIGGMVMRASDNFFELYPNQSKTVSIRVPRAMSKAELLGQLTHMSLKDTAAN